MCALRSQEARIHAWQFEVCSIRNQEALFHAWEFAVCVFRNQEALIHAWKTGVRFWQPRSFDLCLKTRYVRCSQSRGSGANEVKRSITQWEHARGVCCDVDHARVFFFVVDVAVAQRKNTKVVAFVRASCSGLKLKMCYVRCGAASERQRTAVSVVYGIECSVIMKLKWTDEAEVSHVTVPFSFRAGDWHPLFGGVITLFGGVVSSALSGGVVDIGRV